VIDASTKYNFFTPETTLKVVDQSTGETVFHYHKNAPDSEQIQNFLKKSENSGTSPKLNEPIEARSRSDNENKNVPTVATAPPTAPPATTLIATSTSTRASSIAKKTEVIALWGVEGWEYYKATAEDFDSQNGYVKSNSKRL